MKFFASTPKVLARPLQYFTSATMVVIAVGLIGSALAAANASQSSKELLLSQAVSAAAAFSGNEVGNLYGDQRDLTNPAYKSLRRRLISIQQGNEGTRFAYLIGKKAGNQIYFLVDSENELSPDYSPPGTLYPEASSLLKSAFYNNSPIIEGPMKDSYGNWVTAAAPVMNEQGKIVAVLGIDAPANVYYQQIAIRATVPLLLAAIPVAVLIYNRRLVRKEYEITKLKTQFVSIASHELRSPLTGTLWGIQTLLKAKHTKSQEKTLVAIYNNIAASLATVNEILDFSIFERGEKSSLRREIIDLRLVIKDVVSLYKLTAAEKDITILTVGKWPKQSLTVGDQGALKRAFSNLLSNALKYSQRGGRVEIAFHHDNGNHIVGIRDHGIGIPDKDQTKVLSGYYRATNASKSRAYGTGMGLWITRMIIEQHNGRLWLNSKENIGTTVFISLPAKANS